jgi:hypothetical protein
VPHEFLEHAVAATGPIMKQSDLRRWFTSGKQKEAPENDSATAAKK